MGVDVNPEITAVTTPLARSSALWERTEPRRPPGPSGWGWGGPFAVPNPAGDTEPWAPVSQALSALSSLELPGHLERQARGHKDPPPRPTPVPDAGC